MNYKTIILLIVGLLIIKFPQHIRQYKIYEIGEKPTKDFILIQRITGVVFVIISIVMLVLKID